MASQRAVSGRTTGVLGRTWRGTVTPWGDIRPWDGSAPLEWAIAADDRWHFPEGEVSTRQVAISGTPVIETRVRIPGGDAVQRTWSASLRNGTSALLVEFENDSPMPIAVSLSRSDIVTPRAFHQIEDSQLNWPSADRGIARPPVLIPLGHRSRARVALVQDGHLVEGELSEFPDWESVVRGWVEITDGASRLETADTVDGVPIADLIRSRRCEIALAPPEPSLDSPSTVTRWLCAHRELVRMHLVDVDVPEVVSGLEVLVKHVRRQPDRMTFDGLRCGPFLLAGTDERAAEDLARALGRALRTESEGDTSDGVALLNRGPRLSAADVDDWGDPRLDAIAILESQFAEWSARNEVTLLPPGFDSTRLGVDVECHRLIAGSDRRLSFAIRWHGERPAVIWEVEGPPGLVLRSGADRQWSSHEGAGEALWRVPETSSVAR